MIQEYTYKVMLADDGGMTIEDGRRLVYVTDNDMATEMGEWIMERVKDTCVSDAVVTVTIKTLNDA